MGVKNEQGVGAGMAIFSGKELVSKLKYKLETDAPIIKRSNWR
jgi:hypothetical protein